ncbi:LysE family translocator [Solimonas marina]|uniref:LysE family translocator n=1 Tax=Solimonas marina TaxID=2714601 RepID=A0A970B814_9GAMM|nr:LysE family translocator [Solimonas marina]NKF20961.1 LysE family translocator [Solimonas marina]
MQTVLSLLPALMSLAFVSSITPGPNNIMLMNSGVRFGLRRTAAHLAGVSIGFCILLAAAALGLGALIAAWPAAAAIASAACALYLLWLAVRMLEPPPTAAAPDARLRPMRFVDAVLFQWVNPKAWSMAASGATLMAQLEWSIVPRTALLVVVFGAINLPCIFSWALLGAQLRRHLARPRVRLLFSVTMAGLLLATALWMIEPYAPPHQHVGTDGTLAIGR